jgi:hypothetical protein
MSGETISLIGPELQTTIVTYLGEAALIGAVIGLVVVTIRGGLRWLFR